MERGPGFSKFLWDFVDGKPKINHFKTTASVPASTPLSIKISKECVDPNDLGMLEDLVVAAVNSALKKAKELHEKELGKITGGLNLPGLM